MERCVSTMLVSTLLVCHVAEHQDWDIMIINALIMGIASFRHGASGWTRNLRTGFAVVPVLLS